MRLLELKERGLDPEAFVADFGSGLRAGCALAFANTACWGDVFHGLQTVLPVVAALTNQACEAIAGCDRLERQAATHHRRHGRVNQSLTAKLAHAKPKEAQAIALADDGAILADWLRQEVFALGGPAAAERRVLYDFIVAELRDRAPQCAYRLNPLGTFLDNHRDQLLGFADKLDGDLAELAARVQVPVDTLRALLHLQHLRVCEKMGTGTGLVSIFPMFLRGGPEPVPIFSQTLSYANPSRGQREAELRHQLRERCHDLNQALQELAQHTVRASSLVANLNSRLRNYFTLRRHLGADYLALLQFFFNHRRFDRSECPQRAGKSPAELLTGQTHPHWLKMLGYQPFSQN